MPKCLNVKLGKYYIKINVNNVIPRINIPSINVVKCANTLIIII